MAERADVGGKLLLGYRRVFATSRGGGRRVTIGVEIDPAAAARVREVFEAVAAGESKRAAARRVGMPDPQVRRLLKRAEYMGEGDYPRIIEPRLWHRAQQPRKSATP